MLCRVLTCVKLCGYVVGTLCYVVGGSPDATPLVRYLATLVASVRPLPRSPPPPPPPSLRSVAVCVCTSLVASAVPLPTVGVRTALAVYLNKCPPSGCIPRRTAFGSALRLAASCCCSGCYPPLLSPTARVACAGASLARLRRMLGKCARPRPPRSRLPRRSVATLPRYAPK